MFNSFFIYITDLLSHIIATNMNALKMEAEGSSERLVNIYQTTWHHIPEDSKYLISNFIAPQCGRI
jgi:hypothetical protein